MPIARRFGRLVRRYLRQTPSPDETRVLTALAADAASLGRLLARNASVQLEPGGDVNLANGDEREILAATLRAGAAQHLRAGEDLLVLVERLNRMMETASGRRDATQRTALGLSLMRAIAIVELLQSESRDRFPGHAPLARLCTDATQALAAGYVRVLGAELPANLRRAFPHFARAARDADAQARARAAAPQLPDAGAPARPPSRRNTEPLDAPSAS